MSSAAGVEFREASAPDLPALLCMMRGLAEHPPRISFDEGEVGAVLEKFFADYAALGKAWMIVVGERAAGYLVLTLGYSFEFRGRDAFIDELYVEPEFRRRGLGRRAMEFVKARARELGVNAVHLEVDHGNDAAQELYRRAGYDEHGRFLMTKWLSTER